VTGGNGLPERRKNENILWRYCDGQGQSGPHVSHPTPYFVFHWACAIAIYLLHCYFQVFIFKYSFEVALGNFNNKIF
jgi:hypothetical protein